MLTIIITVFLKTTVTILDAIRITERKYVFVPVDRDVSWGYLRLPGLAFIGYAYKANLS